MMRTNLDSCFHLSRQCLPFLERAGGGAAADGAADGADEGADDGADDGADGAPRQPRRRGCIVNGSRARASTFAAIYARPSG